MSKPRNIQAFVSKWLWGSFPFSPLGAIFQLAFELAADFRASSAGIFWRVAFCWVRISPHKEPSTQWICEPPWTAFYSSFSLVPCMVRLNLQLTELASNTRALELNTCLGRENSTMGGSRMTKLKVGRTTPNTFLTFHHFYERFIGCLWLLGVISTSHEFVNGKWEQPWKDACFACAARLVVQGFKVKSNLWFMFVWGSFPNPADIVCLFILWCYRWTNIIYIYYYMLFF